ncbi:MAG: hypothetical protein M4D80_31790 [Myxococcota bacterium]|nr:hypothetical protein [Deltaproteobacteria bacterium]MDQ3339767.1 hypothetical protein [Myxococcota bacterium]
MRHALSLILFLVACGGGAAGTPGRLRFHNADPVLLVNDRKPIAAPKKVDPGLVEYYWREDFVQPAKEILTIEESRRAENINSIGDVPNSTWFTNRQPTPDEIRRGPGVGGPDRSKPWSVVGVKVGGAAVGIAITDGRDERYVLKFDEVGYPETESAADVIVQRLTWAFGYNVPDNEVVTFKRTDLVLDPKAEVKFPSGKKRPMTEADLEKYLGMAESDGDQFRALATKMIGGKIIGGVEPSGTRPGDDNDRVPHDRRRDLRGQRLLWAWVDHVDLKSKNSLATYTDEGFVRWYALDFGESLGVDAITTGRNRLGYQTAFSMTDYLTGFFSFGLYVERHERPVHYPRLRGVGNFESKRFDPAKWQAAHRWRPVDAADRFDELWAAEILMRFSREHIEAAVAAGTYTDPRASQYVVQTLIERQRKIGDYAFSRVAPLTKVDARADREAITVCFDDLWLQYAYGTREATSYRTRAFDYEGRALAAASTWKRATESRTCLEGIPSGRTHDAYTIVEIVVARDGRRLPPMLVHVARGPAQVRVVGIDRR